MNERSPERKAVTLLAAVIIVCLALYVSRGATVISGTKSTFTHVTTKARPGGDPVTSTTSTPSTTTAAKTTTTPTPPPSVQP
jgi:hypothetical protein